MSRLLLAAALASLVATPALAGPYNPRGLLRTGYSDRRIGPDRWEVRASSHDEGGSVPVALYHAAEIAGAAGIAELRVVRQKVTVARVVRRSDGSTVAVTEKTQVTVQAVRGDADRALCEMPETRKCLTLPVAGILSAYGAALGMPVARHGEAPAAPVLLATSGGEWPFPHRVAPFPAGGPLGSLLRGLVGGESRAEADAANARAGYTSQPVAALPASAYAAVAQIIEPAPVAAHAFAAPAPRSLPAPRPAISPEQRYAAQLRAAQPISSDAKLGWTASD